MKDLGETRKEDAIYGQGSPAKPPKVSYPEISLPLMICEGMGLKLGDDVTVTLAGRVSGMEETKWSKRISIEAKQGEIKAKEKPRTAGA